MANEPHARPFDSDTITEDYFREFLIQPRTIGSVRPDISLQLFGRRFETPVMTAALSHLTGLKEDGLVEMARGAAAAGALTLVGMTQAEQYAAIAATGAPLVRIVKPFADEDKVMAQLRQAEALGAVAVGMDVDHIFDRNGEYDVVFGEAMGPKNWDDIARYCAATRLPFLVKGVLHPQEAALCKQAGVGGIVVSHHHGLVPTSVPALMVLPEIRAQVGPGYPVLVDGSITDGVQALKALALGATAVCVGRALIPPIRENGPEGAPNHCAHLGRAARRAGADRRGGAECAGRLCAAPGKIMTITEVTQNKKRYLPLLLLADEQEDMIDRYLARGRMFVLEEAGEVVAECVVTDEGGGVAEIKNLAVAPAAQRRGYGRAMLAFAESACAGFAALQVGTGDSPATVPFYERCGFVRAYRIPGFFTYHYDHPIFEGGVQLTDMVVLRKTLPRQN